MSGVLILGHTVLLYDRIHRYAIMTSMIISIELVVLFFDRVHRDGGVTL